MMFIGPIYHLRGSLKALAQAHQDIQRRWQDVRLGGGEFEHGVHPVEGPLALRCVLVGHLSAAIQALGHVDHPFITYICHSTEALPHVSHVSSISIRIRSVDISYIV